MARDRAPAKPEDNRRTGVPSGRPGKAPKGDADAKRRAAKRNDAGYGRGRGKGPERGK